MLKQVVNGFVFDGKVTCENVLINSWNLSASWELSQQFNKLCQIDEVLNELSKDNLVTKIFDIVSIIS